MAQSKGGRRTSPPDLLTGITADEPEATTRPAARAKRQKAPHPQASPDIVAELQRIATQLDALVKQSAELSAGVKRSASAEADATAALGELRGVVDAAAQGMKQARDDLSERLATIEASAGELPAVPRAAGEIVEQLKLARSNLVGLSERMEGLERRLPEKIETIERAAVAVRETTAGLEAAGKNLEVLAGQNAQVLPRLDSIAREIKKLTPLSVGCYTVVLAGLFILSVALHKRFDLFSGFLPGL